MNLREKIAHRLDELEAGLRAERHLAGEEGQAGMASLLSSVAKFYSVLSDEERDFVHGARMAIDAKVSWT